MKSKNIIRPEGDLTLGRVYGEIIASPFNQHAILMIIGKTGTGKSNAALDIADETAKYLAQVLGGTKEDYFTLDNVAIITMDSIIEVMGKLKYKNVYILDDIGVGWNARDFQKKANKILNNIIQTFRNWNTLLIMTTPDPMLLDAVPRNLLHYQIEMQEQHFKQGISIGKVHQVIKKYRYGDVIYPFIKYDRVKYAAAAFKRAPPDIANEYEKRRQDQQNVMQDANMEELRRINEDLKTKDTDKTPSKRDGQNAAICVLKETNPELTIRQIAKQVGCGKSKVAEVLQEFNLTGTFLSVR